MATRHIQGGTQASPTVPLDLLLGVLPSLPRPMLARLTMRLIDHLDEIDGDPDLEEDDPPGGNVEDEGEVDYEDGDGFTHGMDQRVVFGTFSRRWDADRDPR
jgi:hypothetical protein